MERITFRPEGTNESFVVKAADDAADDVEEQVTSLLDTATTQTANKYEDELDAKEESLGTLKEVLVGEIVRRKSQAGLVDDEEQEEEYLSSLSASRLKREWDRLPEEKKQEQVLSTGEVEEGDEYDQFDL